MELEEIKVCSFKFDTTKILVKPLSKQQKYYVDKIEEYKAKCGKIPTIRTICKLVDVDSPDSVHGMLNRLSIKGYDYKILSYEVEDIDVKRIKSYFE